MKIGIDFDGTCVTHDYPRIGKDIGAVPVLKELVERGHKLILNTMRSGKELEDAVEWFKKMISLYMELIKILDKEDGLVLQKYMQIFI